MEPRREQLEQEWLDCITGKEVKDKKKMDYQERYGAATEHFTNMIDRVSPVCLVEQELKIHICLVEGAAICSKPIMQPTPWFIDAIGTFGPGNSYDRYPAMICSGCFVRVDSFFAGYEERNRESIEAAIRFAKKVDGIS